MMPVALPEVTRAAPVVCPEISWITPGADGPNVVPKELSLIA